MGRDKDLVLANRAAKEAVEQRKVEENIAAANEIMGPVLAFVHGGWRCWACGEIGKSAVKFCTGAEADNEEDPTPRLGPAECRKPGEHLHYRCECGKLWVTEKATVARGYTQDEIDALVSLTLLSMGADDLVVPEADLEAAGTSATLSVVFSGDSSHVRFINTPLTE